MRPLVFSLALLLAACGGGGDGGNNRGVGYDYDVALPDGLRVRYGGVSAALSAEELDGIYHRVEACAGATAAPPLVVFVDEVDTTCVAGYEPMACTLLGSGTILIEDSVASDPNALAWAMAHESVHWILHWNHVLSTEQQYAHDSPFFLDCTVPTVTAGAPA